MNLDFVQVPEAVRLNGSLMHVVSAIFVPGGHGLLDSHIVAYENGKGTFNVHYLVHDDDNQQDILHQGSYDLTYRQAMVEVVRRYNLNNGQTHVEIIGR